jgi:hypothetical protein
MMARNATVPLTGRIQKRKTDHLRIVIFGLQRAAGPYRWANRDIDFVRLSSLLDDERDGFVVARFRLVR